MTAAGPQGGSPASPAAYQATFENCDREPIHSPGSIQPHRALWAFDAGAGAVLQVSTNFSRWLGMGELPAHGRARRDLFGAGACDHILQALKSQAGVAMRNQVVDLPARPAPRQSLALEVLVHSHRGVGFAELEPARRTGGRTGRSCSAT